MKFEMENCGGCRTCELACSFHLSGEFGFEKSALKIIPKESGDGYFVKIVDDVNEPYHCDACIGLEKPVCVQFCHHQDQLQEYIDQIKKQQYERRG